MGHLKYCRRCKSKHSTTSHIGRSHFKMGKRKKACWEDVRKKNPCNSCQREKNACNPCWKRNRESNDLPEMEGPNQS